MTLSWFPAPEGAQYFPGSHLFASRDWRDRLEDWGRLGEIQEAKRRWTTGHPLPKYLGQCFVGDPDWYVNGVPASATATSPLPSCCAPPPEIGAAMLGGGPGMVGIISAGRNLRVGGLSFSGRHQLTVGSMRLPTGGLMMGGSALVQAGRGGMGVLWGGLGPGGLLLRGWQSSAQTGLLLGGKGGVQGPDLYDGLGGVEIGGEGISSSKGEQSGEGGVSWGGAAKIETTDPNSVKIPACPNRIPSSIPAVFDQCTGSLAGMAGERTFTWQSGYTWRCAFPNIGDGSFVLSLDLSSFGLTTAKLTSNCLLGIQQQPQTVACYPFRLEFRVTVGAFQLQCGIPKVFSQFHVVLSELQSGR